MKGAAYILKSQHNGNFLNAKGYRLSHYHTTWENIPLCLSGEGELLLPGFTPISPPPPPPKESPMTLHHRGGPGAIFLQTHYGNSALFLYVQ